MSTMKHTLRTHFRRAPVWAAFAATLGAAVLLQGCGTRSTLSADGMHDQLVFPSADTPTWFRNGTYPLVESLRKLKPGMTKEQVAGLIGRPQYDEGFFGVREWDYRMNVTNEAGTPQFICQLKVLFNSHNEARSFYRQCGDTVETLLDGKWRKYEPPVEVTVPAAAAAAPDDAATLSATGASTTEVTEVAVRAVDLK